MKLIAEMMKHRNCCRKCGSLMYVVHHRFTPNEAWWVSCDNCGAKSYEEPTQELAFEIWRKKLVDEY